MGRKFSDCLKETGSPVKCCVELYVDSKDKIFTAFVQDEQDHHHVSCKMAIMTSDLREKIHDGMSRDKSDK
jgi:hypothetical protein